MKDINRPVIKALSRLYEEFVPHSDVNLRFEICSMTKLNKLPPPGQQTIIEIKAHAAPTHSILYISTTHCPLIFMI